MNLTESGSESLVVRGIGALVTCDPDRGPAPGVVRNAVVAARHGIITYVGPETDLPREWRSAFEIDAAGNAVIPGFVDSHTHLIWAGDRADEFAQRSAGTSYEEIARQGGGIRATARATASAADQDLVELAAERAGQMLRQGTTTVEVKSGYGLDHDAEMRLLRCARELRKRAAPHPDVEVTYLGLHARPSGDCDTYLDDVCRRGVVDASQWARFADVFCDRGAWTIGECERMLTAAAGVGLGLKVHAEQLTNTGAARLAARLGAVSADHLDHCNDDDARALAAAGVTATLLPGATLTVGGPPLPGRLLIDHGVHIALATDCNPGTCYSESMPLMVSLGVAIAGLTPAQAVVAATRGGARALALRDRGMVKAGMRCDLAILATAQWLDVAYHLGGVVVDRVVLGGHPVARQSLL